MSTAINSNIQKSIINYNVNYYSIIWKQKMKVKHLLKASQFFPKEVDDHCTKNKAGKNCK